MSTTYTPRVPVYVAADAAQDAATEAYDALHAKHGRDYKLFPALTCKCGRTFTTPNGLGLHQGAVGRQADKLWDVAYEEAMARAGY